MSCGVEVTPEEEEMENAKPDQFVVIQVGPERGEFQLCWATSRYSALLDKVTLNSLCRPLSLNFESVILLPLLP